MLHVLYAIGEGGGGSHRTYRRNLLQRVPRPSTQGDEKKNRVDSPTDRTHAKSSSHNTHARTHAQTHRPRKQDESNREVRHAPGRNSRWTCALDRDHWRKISTGIENGHRYRCRGDSFENRRGWCGSGAVVASTKTDKTRFGQKLLTSCEYKKK